MKTWPSLVEVLRDRRVRRSRFEQLELGFADRYEMRPHALRLHVLRDLDLEPERVAIKRQRFLHVFHGNPDVIQRRLHLRTVRVTSVSAAVYGSSSRAAIQSSSCCSS